MSKLSDFKAWLGGTRLRDEGCQPMRSRMHGDLAGVDGRRQPGTPNRERGDPAGKDGLRQPTRSSKQGDLRGDDRSVSAHDE